MSPMIQRSTIGSTFLGWHTCTTSFKISFPSAHVHVTRWVAVEIVLKPFCFVFLAIRVDPKYVLIPEWRRRGLPLEEFGLSPTDVRAFLLLFPPGL